MSTSTAVDNDDDAPKKMSIADRIAALNNKQDEQLPSLTTPKANKNAIADKIAALKVSATTANGNDDEKEEGSDKPKVGKLKPPPPGVVPIMFGAGPPTLLSKKQKEREERMNKLKQEAQADDNNGVNSSDNTNDETADKPKKAPIGAVQVMPGSLSPELLKKQQELIAARLKAQQDAHETTTDSSEDVADVGTNDEKNEA